MIPVPRYIADADNSPLLLSVCSLVQSQEKYDRLLASFARVGFTSDNSEFLAADNRAGNRFDGFSWTKALLAEARGSYVIFCHDDVELIEDGFDRLVARLAELDALAPNWLLAGIAGGVWHSGPSRQPVVAMRVSDKFGENQRRGNLPKQVETLDECFLLMRRSRPVISSYDLTGFHFYGADICLQAELAGGTAWAIDFHLRHHGDATRGPHFRACRREFVRKHASYFPDRILHCLSGVLLLQKPDT